MKPCVTRTVAPFGFRPIKGDTMYKSLVETDFILALTLAFATVLIVAGVIARTVRWAARAHTDKAEALPPVIKSI